MQELSTALTCNVTPATGAGFFQASIDGEPLQVGSLIGCLNMRPELSAARRHWTWKVIAEGKVGRKRTSIGLFFDHDLQPGQHRLTGNPKIRVVYNETPHWRSVIYHSRDLQSGALTLLEVDREHRHLRGEFEFAISAIGFTVSEGRFDLPCPLSAL